MTVPTDRIHALYDARLKPRLAALDRLRRQVRWLISKAIAVALVPVTLHGLYFDRVFPAWNDATVFVGLVVFIASVIVAFWRYGSPWFVAQSNYEARFKHEIVKEIFDLVAPGASYEPFVGLAEHIFDESGLFNTRGDYESDDRVRGRIGPTPFEAAEVRRHYIVRTGSGKSSRSETHVVFHGLFLQLALARALEGATIIEATSRDTVELGDRSGLTRLPFQDGAFESAFAVHGSNERETRDIVTPAMRERLLELRRRTEHPLFLCLKERRVYIGVHHGRKLFEPTVFSATSVDAIREMADHFALAELVSSQLALNAGADAATIDDSLLHAADAPRGELQAEVLTSGHLTEAEFRKLADAETFVAADDGAARPAQSRVQVAHDATNATISFGTPPFALAAAAISAVSLVVAVCALRVLAMNLAIGRVAVLLEALPRLDPIDALVAGRPLIWLAISAIVGTVVSPWWVQPVRRVRVEPGVVRIYRGIRPFPKRYPRPLYQRAVWRETVVYLAKEAGASLIHPVASPVLSSAAEARWVAAELQRALRK